MNDLTISEFEGTTYAPQDQGYNEARQAWLRNHDSLPALIAVPSTVAAVQNAVRYANSHAMPIAVRSSGHGAIKPTDGALLIKTQALKDLTIDAKASTATFEPGVTAGELVQAAAAYNLSPITGDSPFVGATGFTLGGGHGWLSRQYGFAADSIVEAQLITATGQLVTINADSNADLLWALKGGSGNFGVVVSLTVRLHPVVRGLAGAMYFDAMHAETLLDHYRNWAAELPESYTAFLQAVSLPPIPFLPESIRGKRVVALQLFFNDESSEAEAALQDFMQHLDCAPLEDSTARMTYADFLKMAPNLPPSASQDVASLQGTIPDAQVNELAHYMQAAEGNPVIQIRPWKGALALPDADALLQYADIGYSIYAVQPLRDEASRQQFAQLAEHIAQYRTAKAFINFTGEATAMQQAYSEQAKQQLAALKNTYDPQNLFRFGHTLSLGQQ